MAVLKDASATGLRPPYLTKFEATDKPLIVLPAFLSRADSTPQADRPRDPYNVVDQSGKPIPEPSADPSALAFEPNPNLAYEKWDEYWRKVHAMRYTHEDGPDDKSMALMLRYDQGNAGTARRASFSGTRSGAGGTASPSCPSPG